MQCLSVKQPAAGLICRSEKTIENRSRKLFAAERYQLPFWCLVHASATWMRGEHSGFTVVRGKKGTVEGLTRTAEGHARLEPPDLYPTGAIIGAMLVGGMVPAALVTDAADLPWCSGPWCLQITAAVVLPEPVPFKGRLGMYDVQPERLGAANLARLAAAAGCASADGGAVARHFRRVPLPRPARKRRRSDAEPAAAVRAALEAVLQRVDAEHAQRPPRK